MKAGLVVDDGYIYGEAKNLTVRKTSMFFAGDGFTVYDCKGSLVFRVDSYGGPDTRDNDEVVLMDAHGRCLLTLRKKRPSLRRRWEGYMGERSDGQKPIFSVRRSSVIGRCGATVEVYGNGRCEEYLIEGSFRQRTCTVVEADTRRKMAEIRRKVDSSTNVMLGKDVFSLNVKPGFDGAFAMGLVLVLDQISGDDFVEVGEEQVHPGSF
ncbi:PREDICTED: protein LURP-one-related 5-like [Tarenaya hassleriana]|uniref:protein LURP-one-related 5-like n=1 Tax=Tarenaya hassleriana TaxID=28532 RepID=UPI00053C6082|nr:PREDICTED: protein LURP-one-related 5-like [Tarenaya hassleriana]